VSGTVTVRDRLAPAPPTPDDDGVLTPRLRTILRRSLFWTGIVVALLALAGIALAAAGGGSSGRALDPEDAAPTGARALATVLGERGVDVESASTIDEVREAAASPADTTVLVHDDALLLDDARVDELLRLADRVVVVDPDLLVLARLAPELGAVGEIEGVAAAGCALPAAERAVELEADGTGYEVLDGETLDAELCFEVDGAASVVQFDRDGTIVTIVGATAALANDRVDERGNAALAIGLLGAADTLVWYLPTPDDVDDAVPTTDELLPRWASPVAVLLLLVGVLAALWRGRRLGPLVVENLPVVVPSSETMEGRARLYARGSARLHALDALRIGTVSRLAARIGLPRSAGVGEVVDAVAALTGRDRAAVAALLVDDAPRDDGELVRRSDELLELERAVERAARP
jgi:hypothetical protein